MSTYPNQALRKLVQSVPWSPASSPRSCLTGRGRRTRFSLRRSRHELPLRLVAEHSHLPLRASFKTRPVRAPGLQAAGFAAHSCRPRALTRRGAGVLKHPLSRNHAVRVPGARPSGRRDVHPQRPFQPPRTRRTTHPFVSQKSSLKIRSPYTRRTLLRPEGRAPTA